MLAIYKNPATGEVTAFKFCGVCGGLVLPSGICGICETASAPDANVEVLRAQIEQFPGGATRHRVLGEPDFDAFVVWLDDPRLPALLALLREGGVP